jgi:hypothetical protein
MSMEKMNPAYGLPDSVRKAALEDAEKIGVKAAAELHKLCFISIYKWRRLIALEETGK